jgi:hypothetical protein
VSVTVLKPEAAPPWEVVVSTESGSGQRTLRLRGHRDQKTCQVVVVDANGYEERVEVLVEDLLDATLQVRVLSGHKAKRGG